MCINIYLCLSITCRPGDANPCAKDGFLVLPSPQAATFNSSFSVSDYLPDTYCLVGTVDDGLWKSHLRQSSCLHVPASSVGDERGSTAHLRPASFRPHLRRTRQPPLAPGSGESTVQDGRAQVQGHSWNCDTIPESTGSCRRSARTNHLLVPSVKLSTVGGQAFPVAGPTIWNRRPDNVISAPSLSTVRQCLKAILF